MASKQIPDKSPYLFRPEARRVIKIHPKRLPPQRVGQLDTRLGGKFALRIKYGQT